MNRYFMQTAEGPLVILMRHGETALNDPAAPRLRAWKNVPLDEGGKVDVQLTAQKLKPYGIKEAFCSDLMRDAETAFIVADILGIKVDPDFDARTWDMGRFEGELLEDVNTAILELYRHPWEYPPGSQESFNDFSARWRSFLDRKMYLAANVPSMRPAMVVTHGKNIAAAHAYIEGILPETAEMPFPSGYAVITVADDRSLRMDFVTKTEPVIEDI